MAIAAADAGVQQASGVAIAVLAAARGGGSGRLAEAYRLAAGGRMAARLAETYRFSV